jgi:hypothetical protein
MEMAMDPFDLETWKHQWSVFSSAPYVLVPAVALGWWIGQKLGATKVSNLNGTITNLNSRIAILEDRLKLANDQVSYAKEREEDVRRAYAQLEKQFDTLKEQIAANAPKETLATTAEKLDVAITQASTANNAVTVALKAVDLTIGSPEFGRPALGTTARSD